MCVDFVYRGKRTGTCVPFCMSKLSVLIQFQEKIVRIAFTFVGGVNFFKTAGILVVHRPPRWQDDATRRSSERVVESFGKRSLLNF